MKNDWSYDFFNGRNLSELTEEDWMDFEAHAELIQDRLFKKEEKEIQEEANKKIIKTL